MILQQKQKQETWVTILNENKWYARCNDEAFCVDAIPLPPPSPIYRAALAR